MQGLTVALVDLGSAQGLFRLVRCGTLRALVPCGRTSTTIAALLDLPR